MIPSFFADRLAFPVQYVTERQRCVRRLTVQHIRRCENAFRIRRLRQEQATRLESNTYAEEVLESSEVRDSEDCAERGFHVVERAEHTDAQQIVFICDDVHRLRSAAAYEKAVAILRTPAPNIIHVRYRQNVYTTASGTGAACTAT